MRDIQHKIITVTDGASEMSLERYLDSGYKIMHSTAISGKSYGYEKIGVQYVLKRDDKN